MAAANIQTPSWPSLYNPGIEILNIEHRDAIQPEGFYLHQAVDVFTFTFYWMLTFYIPLFAFCGIYAFLNLNFPPSPRSSKAYDECGEAHNSSTYPLTNVRSTGTATQHSIRLHKPPKSKERRSRLTFAFLVLLTFLGLGLAGALIGSAILGFTVFGLYKSGHFNVSTWIPFLLAVLQCLIGLMSIWPSIIDIL